MIPRNSTVLQIITVVTMMLTALVHPMPTSAADECILPDVIFLGEGAGTYTLPDGYDTLVVKRFDPFRFGEVEGDSVTFTSASNGNYIARAWAITGVNVPAAHIGEKVSLGIIPANSVVSTIMIDDDDDNRSTIVVNQTESVYTVLQPAMVQPVEFTTNHTGEYFIDSADSIAFWPVCIRHNGANSPTVMPTSTPKNTPTATFTPTMTPTATASVAPTASATPTSTSTPSSTPSATPSATNTIAPTVTLTSSATATQTPVATMTPVLGTPASMTVTPTPTATNTATVAATPTLGNPTSLTPVAMPTLRPEWQMEVWIPIVRK